MPNTEVAEDNAASKYTTGLLLYLTEQEIYILSNLKLDRIQIQNFSCVM